jgi:drug/metabolite transporter (DMT)-like permease
MALAAYAVAFSYAYLRLPAGVGALVLFASVQATMIGAGLRAGERPGAGEWLGLAVAAAGLAVLARPGRAAPDAAGSVLMVLAGVAWGVYTLRGRGATRPLMVTADNFVRTVPVAAVLGGVALASGGGQADRDGVLLAVASGALASGVGYSLWYAALAGLTATRAAIVQLAAPALAAVGGVLMLGEPATMRLVAGGAAVLGGVAIAVLSRRPVPGAAR